MEFPLFFKFSSAMSLVNSTTSALLFYLYIFSALLLTGKLLLSLRRFSARLSIETAAGSASYPRTIERVQIVSLFSILSFLSLSVQMVRFLVHSYAEWARQAGVPFPRPWSAAAVLDVYWRRWPEEAAMFRVFADQLLTDQAGFWWTATALTTSFTWSIYSAVEGTRRQIPSLWAYFALSQILPPSFAQSLLLIAIIIDDGANQATKGTVVQKKDSQTAVHSGGFRPASLVVQAGLIPAFFAALYTTSSLVGTGHTVNGILIVRLFLFSVLPILAPSRILATTPSGKSDNEAGDKSLNEGYHYAYTIAGLSGFALIAWQTNILIQKYGLGSIWELLWALLLHPAVSVLGFDVLIGLGCICVFRSFGISE